MTGLADKVKQAQAAFSSTAPMPIAGLPCPLKRVVRQATPAVAAAPSPAPASVPVAPDPPQKVERQKEKTWVEIVLVDMEGNPLPGVKYRIELPGGEIKEGQLNSYGQAAFYELDPGNCKITFPELDQDAWEAY